MTDKIHALTVVLDHDIREDDIEGLIAAIKYNRFVASVGMNVVDPDDYCARERVKSELREKFWKFYKENFSNL